ncbi:MAG TPA: hypothetical protein VJQ46_02080 [Gemmatimonadales bacterium]|nr:hypothetical protein [Gemmatimonadales bacterium]
MRVTHYARRLVAAGITALVVAACSGDSSAPTEFNAQGTTADMAAAQSAFQGPQVSSYTALSPAITAVLGGSAVLKTSAFAIRGTDATRAARDLAAIVPRGGAIQAVVMAIPQQYLGTTFVWDVASSAYVASNLTGAPSQGVRFLLYAVDPVLQQPVDPLVEVGYVDVTDHGTASTVDVNVRVVEGNVVYLDYDVTAHATSTTSGVIQISGYASDGATLANFELGLTVTQTSTSETLAFSYRVNVPSRSLTLTWTITMTGTGSSDYTATLDFVVNGPNGNVRLTGSYGVSVQTLTIRVNGAVFATVDMTGAEPVITDANGQPLSSDDEASMQAIVEFFEGSGGMLEGITGL